MLTDDILDWTPYVDEADACFQQTVGVGTHVVAHSVYGGFICQVNVHPTLL